VLVRPVIRVVCEFESWTSSHRRHHHHHHQVYHRQPRCCGFRCGYHVINHREPCTSRNASVERRFLLALVTCSSTWAANDNRVLRNSGNKFTFKNKKQNAASRRSTPGPVNRPNAKRPPGLVENCGGIVTTTYTKLHSLVPSRIAATAVAAVRIQPATLLFVPKTSVAVAAWLVLLLLSLSVEYC
jgi:hypothetical protein